MTPAPGRTDDGGSGRPGADDREEASLSRLLVEDEPLSRVAARVAQAARQTVPGVDEASVTLVEDDRARTVAFTGELAVHLDERQYDRGFGPCLDASRSGRLVQVRDTADETRYPDFARQAVRAGVTRSISVGLPVPGRAVGGLNLYARSGTGFDEEALAETHAFAAEAAVVLANAALLARTAEQVQQLRQAMASRSVIEQAKGMVMAARGCSEDEAFAELGQLSRRTNRKLRDVAQEVVDGRGRTV
ncbi:GAF and ANTAR domain-containing protein [Aquipuribacter hungaricus]|uniref:GAF and ANTAR domain-containing protein n=1 Tax=Aquipuribacter hungaricus TaxID=545624 RepID=A0ABV7WDU6_9MICO